jgi:2-polyprenyl-3-methyl-5-hydroxy-6-metoxy-1,4-benzoquinol methylase
MTRGPLMNDTDSDVFESVPCNLCGGTGVEVVYAAVRSSSDIDAATVFRSSGDEPLRDRLVRCTACGLQYVSPRLRHDIVLDGYADGADEQFVSQTRGREITFARCLDLIETYTGGRRGRVLDVGTAAGSFLHVAKSRGWVVDGCEPNRWLCQWGREHYGLDIRPGTLNDQAFPAASFDLVTLWDVLEHTPDPAAVIRECRRVLKPGGLLVVNYPDIGSGVARTMGRSWVFLLSVHLYYFTPATLTRLLESSGFSVERFRRHYQHLALGYILHRSRPYLGPLARLAQRAVTGARIAEVQVPYWMGQTLAIARAVTPVTSPHKS